MRSWSAAGSVATSGYILVGLTLEERDLVSAFGARYRAYRAQVPRLPLGLKDGGRRRDEPLRAEAGERD